jgi:protein ImuA
MQVEKRAEIIASLQSEILRLQGFRPSGNNAVDPAQGLMKDAFPNGCFPLGAVHEFLVSGPEHSAATGGFIMGLLSSLIEGSGTALWISSSRTLFPPALALFGVQPDRIIFIDLAREQHVGWAVEEALKCGALTAVVGEVKEMSFTASRRLQLAVEQSSVTGFILRRNAVKINTTACVSRWRITSLPGEAAEDLPGVGYPAWRVELLRIRNGKPGVWNMCWINGRFEPVSESLPELKEEYKESSGRRQYQRKTG